MLKPKDKVCVMYKAEPWTEYFGKVGKVTAVESLAGTEVVFVRFSDGRTIGFTELELQKIRKGRANV